MPILASLFAVLLLVPPPQSDAGAIVRHQPDFQATLVLGAEGKTAKAGRVAKKGKSFRLEITRDGSPERIIYLRTADGETVAISSVTKTYKSMGDDAIFLALAAPWMFFDEIPPEKTSKLAVEGTEAVDGRECAKIVSKGEPGAFYAAKDLGGLIIRIDMPGGSSDAWVSAPELYLLADVSLSVPDELFRIPEGYTRSEDVDLEVFREPEVSLEIVGNGGDGAIYEDDEPLPLGREVEIGVDAYGHVGVVEKLAVSGTVHRADGPGGAGAPLEFRRREPQGNGAARYAARHLPEAEGAYELTVSVTGTNESGYTFTHDITRRFAVARPKARAVRRP